MAEIIKMNENTWRIEDGGVRCFLLEGKDKALLIDSGMTLPDARTLAEGGNVPAPGAAEHPRRPGPHFRQRRL